MLRAVIDCIVVMSTCPQDMIPINGAACQPTEVHYRLLDRRAIKQSGCWPVDPIYGASPFDLF